MVNIVQFNAGKIIILFIKKFAYLETVKYETV